MRAPRVAAASINNRGRVTPSWIGTPTPVAASWISARCPRSRPAYDRRQPHPPIRAAAQNLALHVVAALAEALSSSPLDRRGSRVETRTRGTAPCRNTLHARAVARVLTPARGSLDRWPESNELALASGNVTTSTPPAPVRPFRIHVRQRVRRRDPPKSYGVSTTGLRRSRSSARARGSRRDGTSPWHHQRCGAR